MSNNTAKKPAPIQDWGQGKVFQSLNSHGYITESLDAYSKLFVKAASKVPGKINLEIGCGFGYATKQALLHNAKIIANDICQPHLDILNATTPTLYRSNLRALVGDFPDNFMENDILKPNSVANILLGRVTHHYNPDKLVRAIKRVHEILIPGGKVFLVSDTPFMGLLQEFLPLYEQRVEQQDPWPGYIENLQQFTSEYSTNHPPMIHLLDTNTLTRVFEEANLMIEKIGYIERSEFPDHMRLDGRESIGISARKI